ncbi:DUF4199 domain-containing protein [Flavobacterium selenitireducens]|uniref:DUF4199 domain-containing protein n=1 Tax=Flavobacterium selenitireducens TaxID=2722704 RepID=UPI00168BC07F|nr:DUF4199 domain-containing protein [Flavobacterium selenitireducens]MBD3582914.1 DUF4199 domain-containing protein [Flavobacterium selenitireducens]
MKKFALEIKWGFLLTLALVASAIVEKEMGLYESPDFSYYLLSTLCFAPIGLLFYILFYREKRQHFFNGRMTWKQGFFAGIMMTAVVALLVPIQKNIIHQVVAPELFENTIAQMTAGGKRSREEAQEVMNLTSAIYNGIQLVLSAGIVASAALSMVFRTKTNP